MAYALIDNATLTAVQRLYGQAQTRSRDSVDGDIVALENLIQGILFYDDLVCIDNYKAEYREVRKKQFSFIRFIDPAGLKLDELEQQASQEAQALLPVIRGGEFVDEDFKAFLDQLKLHIVCTWDISSSIYYLNMKMLGQPKTVEFGKYSNVSATIFSELADQAESTNRFRWHNSST
jgi:hypothetical protein